MLQCTRKGNVNSVSTTVYQQHLLSSHTGLLTIFARRNTIFAHRTAIFDYSFTEQLTLLINFRWGLLSLFLKYELGWAVAVSNSSYCQKRDGLLNSAWFLCVWPIICQYYPRWRTAPKLCSVKIRLYSLTSKPRIRIKTRGTSDTRYVWHVLRLELEM